jgi:hypothetical protein
VRASDPVSPTLFCSGTAEGMTGEGGCRRLRGPVRSLANGATGNEEQDVSDEEAEGEGEGERSTSPVGFCSGTAEDMKGERDSRKLRGPARSLANVATGKAEQGVSDEEVEGTASDPVYPAGVCLVIF